MSNRSVNGINRVQIQKNESCRNHVVLRRLKRHSTAEKMFRQNDSIKSCFRFLIGSLAAVFSHAKEN